MRLLAVFALLVLLGALVDVVAEEMAESRLEHRLASTIDGAEGVEVELRGRPFLLQGLQGSFDGLDLRLASIERQGIEVADLVLALRDLEFSVGEVLDGTGQVQVGGGRGRASITQRTLNARLSRQGIDASISLAGGRATVSAAGVDAPLDAVAITDGGLTFSSDVAGAIRIDLPDLLQTRDQVRYRDARVQDGRVVVLLELPPTAVDPGSL